MTSEELLKETADELERLLSTKNVVGAPIDLVDKTVIPIARFGFGFGAGTGTGPKGGGHGSGGGGGIEPVALIVVHKDVRGPEGIQVLSFRKENPVAEVIAALSESLAPRVIEALKSMNQRKEESPEKIP
ncbi:MAG: sporulation protein [Methanoregulaceae archaeon]|nr:sporulation protein [Methanoregulaceae archaeon]